MIGHFIREIRMFLVYFLMVHPTKHSRRCDIENFEGKTGKQIQTGAYARVCSDCYYKFTKGWTQAP